MSKGLDIDVAVRELLAQQQEKSAPTYPASHRPGMRVPKGGSSCASCEYLADNRTDCTNKHFQQWHGSATIPAPIDEYCSDWYEHDDDLEAYGTSEGVRKEWDERGRGRKPADVHHQGVSVAIFDRYNRPNPAAVSIRTFLHNVAPPESERVKIVDAFKQSVKVGEREMDIQELTPLQNTVNKDTLSKLMLSQPYPNPIDVFHYQGKDYILDGHHRAMRDVAKGKSEITVNLFKLKDDKTLDAYGTSEGVTKAWDTRGRGRKEDDYFAPQPDAPPDVPKDMGREAVKDWVASSHTLRERAKIIITTGKDSQNDIWDKEAHALLDGIRNGATVDEPLYRGISGSTHSREQYLSLKAGDEFQLPSPSSFSRMLAVARSFSITSDASEDNKRVVFEIESGAKGLDVNAKKWTDMLSPANMFENEVITNGRFKVTGTADYKMLDGGHYRLITMKQLGTL